MFTRAYECWSGRARPISAAAAGLWTRLPVRCGSGSLPAQTAEPNSRWWLSSPLAGPVAVTYEAGPTGSDWARDLARGRVPVRGGPPRPRSGGPCRRPGQDRQPRDALLLARLLRMDDLTAVTVPRHRTGGRPGSGPGPGGLPAVI